ncbi:hypothetical protein ACJX0J_032859 [Zea mays]
MKYHGGKHDAALLLIFIWLEYLLGQEMLNKSLWTGLKQASKGRGRGDEEGPDRWINQRTGGDCTHSPVPKRKINRAINNICDNQKHLAFNLKHLAFNLKKILSNSKK